LALLPANAANGVLCSNIRNPLGGSINFSVALALNEIRGELGNATNRGLHQHSNLAHHVTSRIAWYVASSARVVALQQLMRFVAF
jgi:hypothetical protein